MGFLDNLISAESRGNPYARNPRSTATGSAQFIAATWLSMIGKYRPDLMQSRSPAEVLALRNDPALSREMAQAYAGENSWMLEQAGLQASPGNTYLAHFAGPKGAQDVLRADPTTPVAQVLGDQVMKANPFLSGMTVADLQAWASKKMSGVVPDTPAVSPVSPSIPAFMQANAAPLSAPTGLPLFGGQQEQSAQQQPTPDPMQSLWSMMPAQQQQRPGAPSPLDMLQQFMGPDAPPRTRPFNLASLKAFLQTPAQGRGFSFRA